jgi:type II restriction enzyme
MNSEQLRKNVTKIGGGKAMNNAKAKKLEKGVMKNVLEVKKMLEEKYPKYSFSHQSNLSKKIIAQEIGIKNYQLSNPKSNIRPDGGILYIECERGDLYPILIAEAKQQGTNDKRKEEGKKPQAQGNAIERSYKNFFEFKLFCKNLTYFPYVMFISGCDFVKGSSINDRLDCLTEYKPRNKNYVKDVAKIASVYVKENTFSSDEIQNILFDIADTSIKELIKNYDE